MIYGMIADLYLYKTTTSRNRPNPQSELVRTVSVTFIREYICKGYGVEILLALTMLEALGRTFHVAG